MQQEYLNLHTCKETNKLYYKLSEHKRKEKIKFVASLFVSKLEFKSFEKLETQCALWDSPQEIANGIILQLGFNEL